MSLNLHIYQTDVTHASRVRRHCEALQDGGVFNRVEFLGCSTTGDRETTLGDNIRAVLLHKKDTRHSGLFAKFMATRRWGQRALAEAVCLAPDVITCHSLPVLPVCMQMKNRLGCKLMYEPHELETETAVSRGIRQKFAKRLERKLISQCDGIITVCQAIADWYADAYGVDTPTVVRNLPRDYRGKRMDRTRALRDKFPIPDDEQLFLYQGILGQGRRVRQYLEVFADLGRPYHVVFMGNGYFENEVQQSALKHENVHYQEAVPSEDILRHTASADIGLCGVENICLSYYYSLPNKFFEYMTAGIPCLVPEYPEMRRIVEETGGGWLHGDSNEQLTQRIRGLQPEDVEIRRAKAAVALSRYRWENEKITLIEAYKHLLNR